VHIKKSALIREIRGIEVVVQFPKREIYRPEKAPFCSADISAIPGNRLAIINLRRNAIS
jgi:hypothetical protein